MEEQQETPKTKEQSDDGSYGLLYFALWLISWGVIAEASNATFGFFGSCAFFTLIGISDKLTYILRELKKMNKKH